MNNTLSSQSRLQSQMKVQTLNTRRARTRSLIQVGSLLKMVGLLDICRIQEGDDLQLDIPSRDKAAVLIGILLDAVNNITDPSDDRQIETWRESGIRFLKQRSAQVFYQARRI